MKIIFVILFALLAIGAMYLILTKIIFKIEDKTTKILLSSAAILVGLLLEILLISCTLIPGKFKEIFQNSICSIEASIEKINPGITTTVLSPDELKNLLSDRKQIEKYLDSNTEINFIVKTAGLDAYINALDRFCSNIEDELEVFENESIPFNLHNILERLQKQSEGPVLAVVKVFEIIIICVIYLFVIAAAVIGIFMKKEYSKQIETGIQ